MLRVLSLFLRKGNSVMTKYDYLEIFKKGTPSGCRKGLKQHKLNKLSGKTVLLPTLEVKILTTSTKTLERLE